MKNSHVILIGLVIGAAVGYFASNTLYSWPVYSTVFDAGQSVAGTGNA